jgi:hypothetical protein
MLSVPVSSYTDPTAPKPEVERRSVHRYVSDRFPLIRVLIRPSFRPYLANVQDVSVAGLGIICDRCLKPGAVLAVQLQRKHAGVSGILSAQVVHSTPLPDGTWRCGCRLSRSLTDDDLFTLL